MFGPYLQEHLPPGKTAVLFQDHLKCQKNAGYINKLHSFNCESLYDPANKTEGYHASLVNVEGYHASIDIPHERLNDMDYINYSWSKGPTFLPAEHVEAVDSPSEGMG